MARVKVNSENLMDRLIDWQTSDINRSDELIFIDGSIDSKNFQQSVFNDSKMVINIQDDTTYPFKKITFVELLS